MLEFDITLTWKDMYRFNMYQAYTTVQGWMSVVLSILAFAIAYLTYGTQELSYTVLCVLFGIIFLVYMPVSLWLRSKSSLVASKVLSHSLHYEIGEEGVTVRQGEETATLPWEQVYRMVGTRSNVLIYTSRRIAYVVPRDQLGEKYAPLVQLAKKHLEKYRVSMKG